MPTYYRVELTPRAVKEIKGFTAQEQKKIVKALDALEAIPRPPGTEKLTDYPPFWRVKAGPDHRIIYIIEDSDRLIVVATIRDRKDAYRNLTALDAKAILAALQPFLDQPRPPASPVQ
jgi:mRNA-degrading endonuclease RelE of RelBE toxin-antitoxin system